jgi:hypothetical protein
MTDERDPKVSQRYRELGREEPRTEVDAEILAASRRAAETRLAPLVPPTGRRRWYFPVAAAAIITLAVAVTLQVEREQPDPEMAAAPVTVPEAQREEQAAQSRILKEEPAQPAPARKAAPPQVFAPDPKPQATSPQADLNERPAPAAAPPPELRAQREAVPPDAQRAPAAQPESSANAERRAVEGLMKRRDERVQPQAKPAPRTGAVERARQAPADTTSGLAGAMGTFAAAPPEQWLQGIADLRRQGRHEEADKALAEFRKRYPDYKIPEAVLEKVEKK